MRRPMIRFAYWTGIFRCAWVMATTAAITNSMNTVRRIPAKMLSCPLMT